MSEEEGKKDEEKFEFISEGETLGYISLEQARLVAMQTARDEPGDYGPRFEGVRMVFNVVEQEEGEDYYGVTMSFRPSEDFRGQQSEGIYAHGYGHRCRAGRCQGIINGV